MAESTDDIAGSAEAAGAKVREAAGRFADDMRGAADTLLEEQKERVVTAAQGFASALRRSASVFSEEGSAFLSREAGRAAQQVERLADTVHGQTWRESFAEVETMARRRPELFFAAAVAAGFLLGRLVTTSPAAEAVDAVER